LNTVKFNFSRNSFPSTSSADSILIPNFSKLVGERIVKFQQGIEQFLELLDSQVMILSFF